MLSRLVGDLIPYAISSVITTTANNVVAISGGGGGGTTTDNIISCNVHLLDPYTCIARLAQLSFLPEGTLLEFYQNGIYFHLNEQSVIPCKQSIKRTWANMCGRAASLYDLTQLRTPIEQAVLIYAHDSQHTLLFEYCQRGLSMLERHYRSQQHRKEKLIAANTLASYIDCIDRGGACRRDHHHHHRSDHQLIKSPSSIFDKLEILETTTTTTNLLVDPYDNTTVSIDDDDDHDANNIQKRRQQQQMDRSILTDDSILLTNQAGSKIWSTTDFSLINTLIQTLDYELVVNSRDASVIARHQNVQLLDQLLSSKELEFRTYLINTINNLGTTIKITKH